MEYKVKVNSVLKVTHDVLGISTDKPQNFDYTPGQATEISINKDTWRNERRPFTFTSTPPQGFLEFTIKTYPQRKGVTNELLQLKKGDELILNDIFGAIAYKGNGLFIAGGAGITPFISIFRDLDSRKQLAGNKLVFANKTKADIILEEEFRKMLGSNFVNILSEEKVDGFAKGFITPEFLKPHLPGKEGFIYLCGPDPMMDTIGKQLSGLGIGEERIVKEAV